MKDILFISQYYPPEINALTVRVNELVKIWAEEGHQVTVLTGFPNHPSGIVHPDYRKKIYQIVYKESFENHSVIRAWLTTLSNEKALNRIFNYLSFMISSILSGSLLPKPEVIIASSPPLLVGVSGWVLSKIKKVPFILEIRDLWPESIVGTGVLGEGSILIRILGATARFLYNKSDHLIVLTPAFKKIIIGITDRKPEQISIIMNGFSNDRFNFSEEDDILSDIELPDGFIVSYIGNFGWSQGLETVIKAAEMISSDYPEITFLFVGDGAEKRKLVDLVKDLDVNNVKFLPVQPEEKVPYLIRYSDICLVPLRDKPVFETVIPSKMFEIMAGGCPMILGGQGEARKFMEKADCGVAVKPEDPGKLTEAIIELYRDPQRRSVLGSNGKEYAFKHLTREESSSRYLELIDNVIYHG